VAVSEGSESEAPAWTEPQEEPPSSFGGYSPLGRLARPRATTLAAELASDLAADLACGIEEATDVVQKASGTALQKKAMILALTLGGVPIGILAAVHAIVPGSVDLVPVLVLLACSTMLFAVKLLIIVIRSPPEPKDEELVRTKWWIQQHFLWVARAKCCPIEESPEQMEETSSAVQYPPRLLIYGCGEPQVNGAWKVSTSRNGRPQYVNCADETVSMYWNSENKEWRIFHFHHRRSKTLYRLESILPVSDWQPWERVTGDLPVPEVAKLNRGQYASHQEVLVEVRELRKVRAELQEARRALRNPGSQLDRLHDVESESDRSRTEGFSGCLVSPPRPRPRFRGHSRMRSPASTSCLLKERQTESKGKL